jgi:hypothetical protein
MAISFAAYRQQRRATQEGRIAALEEAASRILSQYQVRFPPAEEDLQSLDRGFSDASKLVRLHTGKQSKQLDAACEPVWEYLRTLRAYCDTQPALRDESVLQTARRAARDEFIDRISALQ